MATLFDRLDDATAAICSSFLQAAENDNRISVFFQNTNYRRQCTKLTNYAVSALPNIDLKIKVRLVESHKVLYTKLVFNDTHYDSMMEIAETVMYDLAVPKDLRDDLQVVFENHRDLVFGR